MPSHTFHSFTTSDRGTPLFSSPSTINHNFSEIWLRTHPYSLKQLVIFISVNLKVFMYGYKLCVERYNNHLHTCPLKINVLIFRTDLGSGFHKCSKSSPCLYRSVSSSTMELELKKKTNQKLNKNKKRREKTQPSKKSPNHWGFTMKTGLFAHFCSQTRAQSGKNLF